MRHIQNFSAFNEKLVLINYDEYAELVADAYEAAPEYDEKVLPSYRALIDHAVNKLYPKIIGSGIDVQFVEYTRSSRRRRT